MIVENYVAASTQHRFNGLTLLTSSSMSSMRKKINSTSSNFTTEKRTLFSDYFCPHIPPFFLHFQHILLRQNMSDEDPESGGQTSPTGGGGNDKSNNDPSKQKPGMGQGAKDDIGVCIVIILITVLAIIVTVIKIILFDVTQYPELFGTQATTESVVSTTASTVTAAAAASSSSSSSEPSGFQ